FPGSLIARLSSPLLRTRLGQDRVIQVINRPGSINQVPDVLPALSRVPGKGGAVLVHLFLEPSQSVPQVKVRFQSITVQFVLLTDLVIRTLSLNRQRLLTISDRINTILSLIGQFVVIPVLVHGDAHSVRHSLFRLKRDPLLIRQTLERVLGLMQFTGPVSEVPRLEQPGRTLLRVEFVNACTRLVQRGLQRLQTLCRVRRVERVHELRQGRATLVSAVTHLLKGSLSGLTELVPLGSVRNLRRELLEPVT